MTIRIVKGTTEYEGVPYWSKTSQDVIEGIDDKGGQRLIDLGFAEKIPDPPRPPLQIFPDSPEKIRNKISELETKLAEAQREHEALLDDSCEDVAGITKRLDAANGRVFSLQALIKRQQAKLIRAETEEQLAKEKIAVKNLEKAAKEHRMEAEKILNGIIADIVALEVKAAALNELRGRVRESYSASGTYPSRTCPLLGVVGFNAEWENDIKTIKAGISRDLSLLGEAAERTPVELKNYFNSKRFLTVEQLSAEIREREHQEYLKRKEQQTA